jgi:hypothetical protein
METLSDANDRRVEVKVDAKLNPFAGHARFLPGSACPALLHGSDLFENEPRRGKLSQSPRETVRGQAKEAAQFETGAIGLKEQTPNQTSVFRKLAGMQAIR